MRKLLARWDAWRSARRSGLRFAVIFDESPRLSASGRLTRGSHPSGIGLFLSRGW